MTLDRPTRKFLDDLAESGHKPIAESTPEEARALGHYLASFAGPGAEMARVEDVLLPGGARARLLVPKQGARGVIVYYPGGAWVFGSLDDNDSLARKLAERTSAAVVLVETRHAPEHPYPAAVDDASAALEWAAARLGTIAREDAPLMVAGEGTGANLAAVAAIRARDHHAPDVALQVLVCPIADADLDRHSYLDPDSQHLWPREAIACAWDHYLADAARRTEPEASPLRAPDLAGLPPAVVITAEHDVLRDEGEAFAERLAAAGVPVDARRYTGQIHGFFTLLMLPEGERALQQVVKAIQRCIVRPNAAGTYPEARPAVVPLSQGRERGQG